MNNFKKNAFFRAFFLFFVFSNFSVFSVFSLFNDGIWDGFDEPSYFLDEESSSSSESGFNESSSGSEGDDEEDPSVEFDSSSSSILFPDPDEEEFFESEINFSQEKSSDKESNLLTLESVGFNQYAISNHLEYIKKIESRYFVSIGCDFSFESFSNVLKNYFEVKEKALLKFSCFGKSGSRFKKSFKSRDIYSGGYRRNIILSYDSEVLLVGDIHADAETLISILGSWLKKGLIDQNFKLKKNVHCFFLGDYIDRGSRDIFVLTILPFLGILNPDQVHLIKGNHEARDHCSDFKYKLSGDFETNYLKLENSLYYFYSLLPEAIYLSYLNKEEELCGRVHLSHGGPDFGYKGNKLLKKTNLKEFLNSGKDIFVTKKTSGNLYWNDVTSAIDTWEPSFRTRGYSEDKDFVVLGAKTVKEYLKENGFVGLAKGHHHVGPILEEIIKTKFDFKEEFNNFKKDRLRFFSSKINETRLQFLLNEIYEFGDSIRYQKKPGFCNMGSEDCFIIETIAGPVSNNYLPTSVKLTPNLKSKCLWDIEVISCK